VITFSLLLRPSTAPSAIVPREVLEPAPQEPAHGSQALRPELEVLVRALAALTGPERFEVYAAVIEQACHPRSPARSWDDWEGVRGVESPGGDAIQDCDELRDDE
jgi:hypothetical protein